MGLYGHRVWSGDAETKVVYDTHKPVAYVFGNGIVLPAFVQPEKGV